MASPIIFTAGQVVTAGQLNTLGAEPASWTPALTSDGTSPTMGSGATNVGRYTQVNHLVQATFDIAFGSSMAAGTGTYRVSLPVNVDPGSESYQIVGHGMVYDASLDDPWRVVFVALPGAPTVARIGYQSGGSNDWATASSPITWAQDDRIVGSLLYPADW
jgi:hypothetical protein